MPIEAAPIVKYPLSSSSAGIGPSTRAMLCAHTGRDEKCRCLADYGRVPGSVLVDRVFPRPQNYRLLRSIRSFLVQRHAARKAQHYLGPVWMHFP